MLRAWVFILMIIYLFVWAHLETFTYLSSFLCVSTRSFFHDTVTPSLRWWRKKFFDLCRFKMLTWIFRMQPFFVVVFLSFFYANSLSFLFLCSCAKIHRKYSFWVSPNNQRQNNPFCSYICISFVFSRVLFHKTTAHAHTKKSLLLNIHFLSYFCVVLSCHTVENIIKLWTD